MSKTTLKYALEYVARGWKVLPIEEGGKRPACANGVYDATADIDTLKAWFGDGQLNIGIATGAVSGLLVLDVDKKGSGLESLAKLEEEHGKVSSYTVLTPSGGFHFYFQHNTPMPNRVGFLPGLDIRADDGYVVVPPSIGIGAVHSYKMEVTFKDPAPTPGWLLELLKPKPGVVNEGRFNFLPEGEYGDLSVSTRLFLHDGAKPGYWNAQLFKAAKDMQEQGYDEDYAKQRFLDITGHLDGKDLATIKSAFKNEPKYEPRGVEPYDMADVDSRLEQGGVYPKDMPESEAEPKTRLITATSLVGKMVQELSDPDKRVGKQTYLPSLNKFLGGFRTGEMTALAAIAGAGKSTALHNLIKWMISGFGEIEPESAGYISREMSPSSEVLPDLLSLGSGSLVQAEENLALKQGEYLKILEGWEPLYFPPGIGPIEFPELALWIRQVAAMGVKQFFLDHLHLTVLDSEDHKELARYLNSLKNLVMELNIHLFLIIQPKNVGPDEELNMTNLRGGAAINQVCNNILILQPFRENGQVVGNISTVRVEKVRGKLGRKGTFYVRYEPKDGSIIEVTKEEAQAPKEPEGFQGKKELKGV